MQMRIIRYLYSSEDNLFDLLCLIGTISGSDLQALQHKTDTLPKKGRLAVALLASIVNVNRLQTLFLKYCLECPIKTCCSRTDWMLTYSLPLWWVSLTLDLHSESCFAAF